jgi:hypothetical protein
LHGRIHDETETRGSFQAEEPSAAELARREKIE